MLSGWFVDIIIEWLVRIVANSVRRIRSRSWPVVAATVTNAASPRADYGCHVADIHYDYSMLGETFSGIHEEPFVIHDAAKDYVCRFPAGCETPVRVKRDDPSVSVLVRG